MRGKRESQILAYRKGRKKSPGRKPRRPHARIGTRHDRQIIRLYKQGRSQVDIETTLDLPHGSVRRRLNANGVPIRPKRGTPIAKKLPMGEFERTAFMYVNECLSIREVADALGISPTAVSYRLRVVKVPRRPRGGSAGRDNGHAAPKGKSDGHRPGGKASYARV